MAWEKPVERFGNRVSSKDRWIAITKELIVKQSNHTLNLAIVDYEGHVYLGRALADHVNVCALN